VDRLLQVYSDANRFFLWLFLIQWAFAVGIALLISPYAWSGKSHVIHFHVELAVLGGALLNSLPLALIWARPNWAGTRHVIAVTQLLWSAVFIHLTGGRNETHFHIFVSLAFLLMYRDPWLLFTAVAVVAADHLTLGMLWPESVYGIANPEWWRFLEHGAWVVFEAIVLVMVCNRALFEMRALSRHEATLELEKLDVDAEVATRTKELTASGERYRALVEDTSAMPWEIDSSRCQLLYLSPQLAVAAGRNAEDFQGHSLLELLHPEDRAAFQRFISLAAAHGSGRDTQIDSRLLGAGKSVTHIRSFVGVQGNDTEVQDVFGISIDITQQKSLEMDLMQAQKLESIGQLSAGIAHEINTPTQFIGDNIRFLQESLTEVLEMLGRIASLEGSDAAGTHAELTAMLSSVDMPYFQEEIPRAISQSLEGIGRISAIVSAMKEFSHPTQDSTLLDLNRAITNTITVASSEWKYVADLKTDFDKDLPAVPVLPGAFNQVILNILINAAHAVGGSVAAGSTSKGTIWISTRQVDPWVEIRIRDTGGGIPQAIQHRIFDPFFTTKEVGKGTGQGLAIAHDVIVNKHKGTIAIEVEPQIGTTFVVRLPLAHTPEEIADVA
jgi:PAS domain S-box-containing protein